MEEQRLTPDCAYASAYGYTQYGMYPHGYHGYATGYPYSYPWPSTQAYDSAYYSYYGAYAYPSATYQHPDAPSSVPTDVTVPHVTPSTPLPVAERKAVVPSCDVTDMVKGRKKVSAEEGKPPYSYIALIAMAISNSRQEMATLREIISYIQDRFPYFKTKTTWQRSLRHCLTLNDCFVKKPRRGKGDRGHPWAIDPEFNDMFDNGSLARRRYRFKEGSVNWHRSRARAARAKGAVKMEQRLPAMPSQPPCSSWFAQGPEEQRGTLDSTLASENSVLSIADVPLPSETCPELISISPPILDESAQPQDFWSLPVFTGLAQEWQ